MTPKICNRCAAGDCDSCDPIRCCCVIQEMQAEEAMLIDDGIDDYSDAEFYPAVVKEDVDNYHLYEPYWEEDHFAMLDDMMVFILDREEEDRRIENGWPSPIYPGQDKEDAAYHNSIFMP